MLSLANVDCPPRRTLIRDSFGAFHRDTFVWRSLCGLKGTSRDLRQFAPKAVSNFVPILSPGAPGGSRFNPPTRPHPKSVSSRRIECAAQRRSDYSHRSLGKVDPGFASFESTRHPTARSSTVPGKPGSYLWHEPSVCAMLDAPGMISVVRLIYVCHSRREGGNWEDRLERGWATLFYNGIATNLEMLCVRNLWWCKHWRMSSSDFFINRINLV